MSEGKAIVSPWLERSGEISKVVETPRSWLLDSETIREWNTDGSRYCKHGTDVGHAWGRDILCPACEDGMTDTEYDQMMEIRMLRAQFKAQERLMVETIADLVDLITDLPVR